MNAYELIYKFSRGKLPVAGPLLRDLSGYLRANQLDTLPISFDNAVVAGRLSSDHRDPFDRLLAAQALIEDLTLVSIDDKLDQFGIKRLW